MIVVSACLLGKNCRYDGGNCSNVQLIQLLKDRDIIPICPEISGGLPVPRSPSEIINGDGFDVLENRTRVISSDGQDVTLQFLKGSNKILKECNDKNIKLAILKARSPSCGVKKIYNGQFAGKLRPGPGVTAASFKNKDIPLYTEDDIEKIKKILDKS